MGCTQSYKNTIEQKNLQIDSLSKLCNKYSTTVKALNVIVDGKTDELFRKIEEKIKYQRELENNIFDLRDDERSYYAILQDYKSMIEQKQMEVKNYQDVINDYKLMIAKLSTITRKYRISLSVPDPVKYHEFVNDALSLIIKELTHLECVVVSVSVPGNKGHNSVIVDVLCPIKNEKSLITISGNSIYKFRCRIVPVSRSEIS